MARPVIALLTDFGTRDHYAGTMKGVVARDLPRRDARRHHPRHRRARRARRRARARARRYRTFPPARSSSSSSIPGVGSARRGIAAEAGDHRFVAPDNGVLTAGPRRARAEADRRADRAEVRAADRQPDVRGTRSLCAGRRLAGQGIDARALGRPAGAIQRLDIPRPRSTATCIDGESCCASIASATS